MSVLHSRDHYKPFNYPWAFELFKKQNQMHWMPEEVSFSDDIRDFNENATEGERYLIEQIFRFFTQADTDVADGYVEYYLPLFPQPEIRMMLLSFAQMEGIHQHAYSQLLDTLGMPESEYKAFMQYKVMLEKHEFLFFSPSTDPLENLAYRMAVISAFGEGMQLFSSFAMLLSFQFNDNPRKMFKGMCQIVTWSIKDETLHVQGLMKLFDTLIRENPHIWTDQFKKQIYDACRKMVHLEDLFIDLAFQQGECYLTPWRLKQYIRYTADRRLLQLGLKPNYGVEVNPIPELDWMVNAQDHTNFFEQTDVNYSKGTLTGDWADVF